MRQHHLIIITLLCCFAPTRAHALPPIVAFASPTTIDEGREVTLSVTVTDPEGAPVTWSWDTDFDSVFGELPDATSYTVPATSTDGARMLRIGVRATDGTEERTVYRTIQVNNVAPVITSHPPADAEIRREYRYQASAFDPAGAHDPIERPPAAGP